MLVHTLKAVGLVIAIHVFLDYFVMYPNSPLLVPLSSSLPNKLNCDPASGVSTLISQSSLSLVFLKTFDPA